MTENKNSSIDLGVLIAFVAPGFMVLEALALRFHEASDWVEQALKSDQSVGAFLFAALASLSLGLVVSGVRALALDWLYKRGIVIRVRVRGWCMSAELLKPIEVPQTNFRLLDKEGSRDAYLLIVENYYRYYQFYSNTLIAVLVLVVCAWNKLPTSHLAIGLAGSVAALVLFSSARNSYQKMAVGLSSLFGSDAVNDERTT